MPTGAKVIHVDGRHGQITLWALVDNAESIENHKFRIIGTGHDIPADIDLIHVGSCQIDVFVWHVFEERDGKPEEK
jgi:hypothetical protein